MGINSSFEENDHEHIESRLLRDRIIFLGSVIDDEIANTMIQQLRFLEEQDVDKDIFIYINSPGGSVPAGLNLYNAMQKIKPDIATICVGLAASMAAIVLSAGTKGKRMAQSTARIVINRPVGGKQIIQPEDLTSATWQYRQELELGYYRQTLAEIFSIHTGQSVQQIYKDTEIDYCLSSQEALQYGFIDRIIDR